jgi:hypothetical protein
MKKVPQKAIHLLVVSLLVLLGSSARAGEGSVLADDNATVQVAGPRMGDNGKRFFNMEGNQNGDFSSFGVADFTLSDLGRAFENGRDSSLTVTLVQSNAGFTHDGELHFWLTTDTTTCIQPGEDPAVKFDLGDDPDGLTDQLSPRFFLGAGTFTEVESGQVDAFTFQLSRSAHQYLRHQIETEGKIRIVVSPADGTVAATYAGYTNTEFSGPVLTVDVAN